MREIINIFIGQFGVQSGKSYWDQICAEHNIDNHCPKISQLEDNDRNGQINGLFYQSILEKLVPRTVFVDYDPSTICQLKKNSNLFHPEQMISGKEDTGGIHSRGKYFMSNGFIDSVLNIVRKEAEKCDGLQGFVVHRSLSGGTGAGFGGQLLSRMTAEYPKLDKINSLLIPSLRTSNEIVEPYNFVLSGHDMIEHTDANILFQNEALNQFCENHFDIEFPNFDNLNKLIAQVNSSVTSPLRFEGNTNCSLYELRNNAIPYPRINLLLPSYSASNLKINGQINQISSSIKMCSNIFKRQHYLVSCDPSLGKYLTSSLFARGDVSQKDIFNSINIVQSKQPVGNSSSKRNKITNCLNKPLSFAYNEKEIVEKDALLLANNTSVVKILRKCQQNFDRLFDKRAFVHWYVGEGMESDEFHEARENLIYLAKDYDELNSFEDPTHQSNGNEEEE